jgi:hypothetical protein
LGERVGVRGLMGVKTAMEPLTIITCRIPIDKDASSLQREVMGYG